MEFIAAISTGAVVAGIVCLFKYYTRAREIRRARPVAVAYTICEGGIDDDTADALCVDTIAPLDTVVQSMILLSTASLRDYQLYQIQILCRALNAANSDDHFPQLRA